MPEIVEAFKVTCLGCGGSDVIRITADKIVFYTNHFPIIAARFRPDLQWGFECGECGNDSRLAFEEKDKVDILVKAAPETIKQIAAKLKHHNERLFRMEPA
jgi:hypothetical protein